MWMQYVSRSISQVNCRPLQTVLLALVFSIGVGHGPQVQAKVSCESPRFSEIGWTDIAVTTALTTQILEGLGYAPKVKMLSIPVTFAGLQNKDLDIFLGYWWPSMRQDILPYLQKGVLESPMLNLEGAKYTLAVPKYVFDQGVKNFADLSKFKDKFEGKIYGIEPGNDGNRIIQSLIDKNQFQLKGWNLVESSEQGMLTQVLKKVARKKWIVFLGWAPHPMNKKVDMVYLEGGDQFFGPRQGESKVYTVVRKNYLKECPQVAHLLSNLTFTVEMENTIMLDILERNLSPQEAAKNWLKQHPTYLDKWLAKVKTVDGKDGLVAVKRYLGLSS